MPFKALQNYTYYSKYAGYSKDKKRRETWNEAVDRMLDMHLRRYSGMKEEIEWIRPLIKEKRFLGSQRALQFGGAPIEKKHSRLYNCSFSYCDRPRFFQEALWLLLCGSGAGYSVQKHHIAKLPEFTDKEDGAEVFVIPDSIEGWADALGILLASYMPHPEYPEWEGKGVTFDYSLIRPAGSQLGSGVGRAPGPDPLKKALERIDALLQRCLTAGQDRLRPIDAHDIILHASDAVLSGGVRRSSCIALFSPDDVEMSTCKTGNWFYDNPQRARANNSAVLLRGETKKEDFFDLIKNVKEFGEPGFVWVDSLEAGFNPCSEIGLYAYDEDGNSGWSFCNLCEINGKKIKCKEDFALAARGAAILGTMQAGYTTFEYLGPVSERIVRREALLGISITGMMDNPHIIFNPEIQKEMAQLIVQTNEWVANKIGINPAARSTCIKPSGTTSCILGTASGVHPHHAKRYLRRVQANQLEPVLQFFKQYNPEAIEPSVWSANGTDEVITFVMEIPDGAKTKNQLSAIDLLEHVRLTQQNWVLSGKNEKHCTQKWLNHNVSNTISVRPNEWEEVAEYIYKNRKWFAGISLLPMRGDLDYPQAPFTTVHTPHELLKEYGDGVMFASGLIVDGLHAFDNNLWAACDAAMGLGNLSQEEPSNGQHRCWVKKKDWVRRVNQFAERYLNGDVRKTTYLLKEINNWKKFLDLRRTYQVVPYEEFYEEENNTTLTETIACAGGACSIHI